MPESVRGGILYTSNTSFAVVVCYLFCSALKTVCDFGIEFLEMDILKMDYKKMNFLETDSRIHGCRSE